MAKNKTQQISMRLDTFVYSALAKEAKNAGLETNAHIERCLNLIAIKSGFMDEIDSQRIKLEGDIIRIAINTARTLVSEGKFNEHFTLIVFQELMQNPEFISKYETAIGGKAREVGLKGKSPLNMYLGWYIKNAVGADPLLTASGKPKRAQVKNEPIQSYTLLTIAQ